ncbi:MAG: ferrous iron transport protein A [Balneolaceae bacterium]|nr:ferrous iron transport protein A [Balneolaceae bacterium]
MPLLLSEKTDPGVCQIRNITGSNAPRLLEMGITPGISIEVIRSAPLGFPIEIKLRGYSLSLRKSEAQCIEIEQK